MSSPAMSNPSMSGPPLPSPSMSSPSMFSPAMSNPVFTARAYARAVLGVVILSVRPSVRPSVCLSHAWIVTKLNDALQIFYTTRKGNHSATLTPTVVGRRRPLPFEICVQTDPPPSKNADFDRFPLITSQP